MKDCYMPTIYFYRTLFHSIILAPSPYPVNLGPCRGSGRAAVQGGVCLCFTATDPRDGVH